MMKARVIAFLVILFVLVPAALAQTGGQESPSGTPQAPINGPALKLDTPATVQLAGTTPVNLTYKTNGNETVSITARSLEAEGVLDPTLTVLDMSGQTLASNDDHGTTDRSDLTPRDSLIDSLTLTDAGRYVVQVAGADDTASGNVEVLVSSGASSTEIPSMAQAPREDKGVNVDIKDTVPPTSPYTTTFQANEGDVVTITVKATDNQLDPKVALLDSSGAELANNDDSSDPSLGPYDSQIPNFTIPKTDTYTVSITGFAGIGGTFELIIQPSDSSSTNSPTPTEPPLAPTQSSSLSSQVITGSINAGDTYTYDLQVNAGDVYTITVQSTSKDLDPRVSIYDSDNNYVFDNDDYGSSDPNMQSTDAQIDNWIFRTAGKYFIDVRGFQDSAGSFKMTLTHVATGAPTGDPTEEVVTGEVKSGETYSYSFDAQAGDWVTIAVRGLTTNFDPYLSLSSEDGTVLLNNDNNGTSADYAYYDSLIHNYHITTSGQYLIEVTGSGNTAGTFGLTIGTLR